VTEEQLNRLNRTQAIVGPAIVDRYGMLVDFMDEAGISDTENIVTKANLLLPDFDRWLLTHEPGEGQTGDLLLIIALFVGEIFCQRWSGCWLLIDKPDSPHFGNYVVGKFKNLPQKGTVINPFFIATEFLEERDKGPYARGLEQVIADVEKGLQGS
jgi:hypothetical protein